MKTNRLTILVVGLVLTLGRATSWGQDPSGNDISDGNDNTGGGSGALVSNTIGTFNTAYGHSALSGNTSGILNTAIGQGALTSNTTGFENTAVGAGALANNTGPTNGCNNDCGFNNTAIGFQALYSNGSPTTSSNQGGNYNTAVGNNALFNTNGFPSLFEASNNTGIGNNALFKNVGGMFNTAIGDSALLNAGGSGNIAIGASAGANLTSGGGNIYLGSAGGTATESKTMRLGQGQTRTFVAGIYSAHASARQVFINSNGQLGTLASSARYKRDIRIMGDRSRGLLKLRPVTFHYKFDPQGPQQYGLIAEEVAKVYPDLVTKGEDGKVESVQYHELIPMLLNEVQHQQQALDALKAENARLQATVSARLERLEAAVQNGDTGFALRLSSLASKINVKQR
jgi:Chaperone of endosialidase